MVPCFSLVLFLYVLIDAYNRSALGDAATMDLLQSLDLRFPWSLSSDSHPANGPIPFRIGKLRLLYFPFSPPCAWPGVGHTVYNKPNAWISFTDSIMWLPPFVPQLHASQHKPRPFAPSIRHVRRSSPCHCSPL